MTYIMITALTTVTDRDTGATTVAARATSVDPRRTSSHWLTELTRMKDDFHPLVTCHIHSVVSHTIFTYTVQFHKQSYL